MTVYEKMPDFSEDEIDLRCIVAELFCLWSALNDEATVPCPDMIRDCVYGIYRHSEDVFNRLSDKFGGDFEKKVKETVE